LRKWGLSAFFASQVAVATAIFSNFALNNRVTFKRNRKQELTKTAKLNRFSQFILYSLCIINLQSLWMYFFVDFFGPGCVKENLILAVGVGFGSILNYLFYSNVIWRHKLDS
jgi:dolichol-phosphate mannosyltransferase